MSSITDATIIHHVGIVFLALWLLNSFNCCHPFAYFLSLIYLYMVHELYASKLRRKLQFEEKRQSSQRRVLSDSESVRWLNYVIEKIWPLCMEEIVSQKILLSIIPWFLQKYKPWTAKEAVIQHLYMGSSPPMFTEMRVLRESTGDDHLVLELGMNFRAADDMRAILAVKLRKRLGFGMWAKLHLLGMHVEGKVLVGVKFLRKWPFLGRLRVCFVEPPYFQMTVKPIFTRGLDVTELPGIAGWMDKLLTVAFEETLVEPNMLVVDVEKFVSPQPEDWFSVDSKEPVAFVILEVIEAADMKPSDLNGLADPYVKGHLGPCRFRSKTKKKTLTPKWNEEFKIPVSTWEPPNNMLNFDVRDKDHFIDDTLGDCSINICNFRDGQRHDMWLSLQNIKMGRLHVAITVVDCAKKGSEQSYDSGSVVNEQDSKSAEMDKTERSSLTTDSVDESSKAADKFEPINIEGQRETGIWVHHPGSEVAQVWEPRKGKSRVDGEVLRGNRSSKGSFKSTSGGSSHYNEWRFDESVDGSKPDSPSRLHRGLRKISSLFHRSPREEDKSGNLGEPDSSPHANLRAVNAKEIGVKIIVDDTISPSSLATALVEDGKESHAGNGKSAKSAKKGKVRNKAKKIFKHAGRSVGGGIKKVISRKSSEKSKGEPESSDTEILSSEESDSSDEESRPSSLDSPQAGAPSVGNTSTDSPGIESSDTIIRPNESIEAPDEVAMDSKENHVFGQSSSFKVDQ
ncbi:C2 domain-containing protein isoform X1 [Capsicum chacoense]|uniref:C2 domain-containing protein n=2 Tax=Capsicum annuum TaxID=4072 RepID=A0A2G2Z4M9_CAPAN|nr:C2 domain-containing protein At1g53590 isoform X1 [Capsicum annuum]KAF3660854.1 C2 domain-containing protein [Capsicum annuum]PHT76977.1 C2 domain-containing protein [Capsicum annuum]